MREASNIRLSPLRRSEYDRIVEGIRAHLDDAAFAKAWQEGRAMQLEQVLAAQGLVAMPATVPAGPSSVPCPHKASTAPSGLTAREVEVLRLLARGLTNPQIIVPQYLLCEKAHINAPVPFSNRMKAKGKGHVSFPNRSINQPDRLYSQFQLHRV